MVSFTSRNFLVCDGLTKTYGNVDAIEDLNFVANSDAIGLFGPNGSGKSTLIKLLMGIIHPSSGSVKLDIPVRDIRFIPDFPKLPLNLTIDQWLTNLEDMFGDVLINQDIQEIADLDSEAKIGSLSAGQYRLAALLPIFHGAPKLIVLDEPTNFLDMILRDKILELLKEMVTVSKSKVIMASHRIDEITSFSQSVVMLDRGRLIGNISLSLENRNMYALRVNDTIQLSTLFDESNIDYTLRNTILGETFVLEMSWVFWKILHRFTKEGGMIYGLNIINEFEDKLGELARG